MIRPVHLDTDIGSDVDDALALALLLGSPEIELVGISTVYGDTTLRAKLAARLARTADPDTQLRIAAGATTPRSGRAVWWAGHEGRLHTDLDTEPIAPDSGVRLLIENARTHAGRLEILAIGPLTNLAAALDADPTFERNVRRVVIMGGDFGPERTAEHNILCDVAAAQRVLHSHLALEIGGLDLTTQTKLEPAEVDQIGSSGALGTALHAEIAEWWRFHGNQWNTPHDPLLALWMLQPELFTAEDRHISLAHDGVFATSASGYAHSRQALIIRTVDSPPATSAMVERIRGAGSRALT